MFEEFQRVGEAGGDRGIGLGLAIVQRAGRMLDHPITLTSAPGQGSTFGVAVPLGEASVARYAGSEPAARGQLAGTSVLVIDNDRSILDGMTAILTGWGCRVATALGMPVAADGDCPDVIVADYHLDDGITGDAVAATIRARCGDDIPAVIITADRTPELRDALSRQGFYLLTKPVKPAQLRALLTRLTR